MKPQKRRARQGARDHPRLSTAPFEAYGALVRRVAVFCLVAQCVRSVSGSKHLPISLARQGVFLRGRTPRDEILQNLAGPCPHPYLPTYLPTRPPSFFPSPPSNHCKRRKTPWQKSLSKKTRKRDWRAHWHEQRYITKQWAPSGHHALVASKPPRGPGWNFACSSLHGPLPPPCKTRPHHRYDGSVVLRQVGTHRSSSCPSS